MSAYRNFKDTEKFRRRIQPPPFLRAVRAHKYFYFDSKDDTIRSILTVTNFDN